MMNECEPEVAVSGSLNNKYTWYRMFVVKSPTGQQTSHLFL